MKTSLLKTMYPHDPLQHVEPGKWHRVTFHEVSTHQPDDFGFASGLPMTSAVMSDGGLLELTLAQRFIQPSSRAREPRTLVSRLMIRHPKYKAPKKIGQTRILTNGPCDHMMRCVPFHIESGTEVWAELWQDGEFAVPLALEYCYLSVALS